MAIAYNIYSNSGTGSFVDYTKPIGTTIQTTFTLPPLEPGTDTLFSVRAIDTTTGLEDHSTNLTVRIRLDDMGNDITGTPNPPHAVTASNAANGTCRVNWAYVPTSIDGIPDGFFVYITPDSTNANVSPTATIDYSRGQIGYTAVLIGPFNSMTYNIFVCSYNKSGLRSEAKRASLTLSGTPKPFEMGVLTASL